jgi:hypothetical protein
MENLSGKRPNPTDFKGDPDDPGLEYPSETNFMKSFKMSKMTGDRALPPIWCKKREKKDRTKEFECYMEIDTGGEEYLKA